MEEGLQRREIDDRHGEAELEGDPPQEVAIREDADLPQRRGGGAAGDRGTDL
ncbi:MAG TPA: hypothetical protein VHE08_08175 [Solirubrobacterales bacterium]|nr:hypothetical protein [Solirubrobacterales bacterium]